MNIALLGTGVVGLGVFRILETNDQGIHVTKILTLEDFEEIHDRKVSSIEDILNDDTIDTVVEAIGGLEPAHTFVTSCLMAGKNVVTTNKELVAAYYSELQTLSLKYQCLIVFSASCGGSIPWLYNLTRANRLDKIESLAGIMNGTSNYILTKMTKENLTFAEALKQAQAAGYAEADPSADIDGLDTKRKLAISLNTGYDAFVIANHIPTAGVRTVTKEIIDWGKAHKKTLKLIGKGKENDDYTLCGYVEPTFVDEDSMFAHTDNAFNYFTYTGQNAGTQSYYGEGAGRYRTAYNVVEDLLDIQSMSTQSPLAWDSIELNLKNESHAYFVATEKEADDFLKGITLTQEGNFYTTKVVSVKEMHEWLSSRKESDETVFIAGL